MKALSRSDKTLAERMRRHSQTRLPLATTVTNPAAEEWAAGKSWYYVASATETDFWRGNSSDFRSAIGKLGCVNLSIVAVCGAFSHYSIASHFEKACEAFLSNGASGHGSDFLAGQP